MTYSVTFRTHSIKLNTARYRKTRPSSETMIDSFCSAVWWPLSPFDRTELQEKILWDFSLWCLKNNGNFGDHVVAFVVEYTGTQISVVSDMGDDYDFLGLLY